MAIEEAREVCSAQNKGHCVCLQAVFLKIDEDLQLANWKYCILWPASLDWQVHHS